MFRSPALAVGSRSRFLTLGLSGLTALTGTLAPAPVAAADAVPAPFSIYERGCFFATAAFDDESFFFGASSRAGLFRLTRRSDLGLRAFASFRPQDRWTRESQRPHFFIQRKESYRNVYGATADIVYRFGSTFGLYGGGGLAYSHGNYAGTSVDPGSGWSWVADGGVTLRFRVSSAAADPSLLFRIGFQRADRYISGNRMVWVAVGAGT